MGDSCIIMVCYVYLNVIISKMLASDLGLGSFSSLFVASMLSLQ